MMPPRRATSPQTHSRRSSVTPPRTSTRTQASLNCAHTAIAIRSAAYPIPAAEGYDLPKGTTEWAVPCPPPPRLCAQKKRPSDWSQISNAIKIKNVRLLLAMNPELCQPRKKTLSTEKKPSPPHSNEPECCDGQGPNSGQPPPSRNERPNSG